MDNKIQELVRLYHKDFEATDGFAAVLWRRLTFAENKRIMTGKERADYVSGKFLECIKEIKTVRKGRGCKVGESYWFEYVHDTNDGEEPDADAFYRKLSDNKHYDEVFITDNELLNNFRPCKDKSSEPKTKKNL